jgi:putative ABC transport system permease protein
VVRFAFLRGMARSAEGGEATLVEMKAVDAAYPAFGRLVTDAAGAGRSPAALRGGRFWRAWSIRR